MTNFESFFRQMTRIGITLLVVLFTFSFANASEQALDDEANVLQVFVRDGCPHCADAKAFLPTLQQAHPGLQIVYRQVDKDPAARDALMEVSRQAGIWPPGVPTFVYHGQVLAGFGNAEESSLELEALLQNRLSESGHIESGLFGTISVERLGLPLFTLAVGLLDGFNPCAMWVLLFLLSMLIHLNDRLNMSLIAGTFVIVSGLVYYAFMAAWLNIFLAVGLSAPIRITLAVVAMMIGMINIKDFIKPGAGVSLSIPASAKPGIYARIRAILQGKSLLLSLTAAASLAIVVNFIELLCTAGLPAIYTAILTQQAVSPEAHYAYLVLYILGYITDDALMVTTAVIALSSSKLTQRTGQWLKLLSGAVMLALGLIMLFKAEWLV
jgi:hypothetical protein